MALASPLAGLQTRPAQQDDFETVLRLIQSHMAADYGTPNFSADDLDDLWQASDLTRDTLVIIDERQQQVGYAHFMPHPRDQELVLRILMWVQPECRDRGVEQALIAASEERARLPAAGVTQVILQPMVTNEAAQRALEQAGFTYRLTFETMSIELHDQPPQLQPPSGITIRPFVVGADEQAAYLADEEASRDKGYARPVPYEAWTRRMLADPSLCFVAEDGEAIAGGIYCEIYQDEGYATVHHLGVRRQWRKRGLGMALLQHAFVALFGRGARKITFDVDGASRTGANRLYLRAGMQKIGARHYYEKQIEPATAQRQKRRRADRKRTAPLKPPEDGKRGKEKSTR